MSVHGNSRSDLFGSTSSKSYATDRVWKGSVHGDVKFAPLGANRDAARAARSRIYHDARRFERQTRNLKNKQDGKLGRNGLAILHAMLFDFIDDKTGRLDPGYEAIARVANISIRSVARGIQKLKAAGVLSWINRAYHKMTAPGAGWERAQDTNAYAIAKPGKWKGFRSPAPAPEPGTCGEHPSMPEFAIVAGDTMDRKASILESTGRSSDDTPSILGRMTRWIQSDNSK